jgi:hypothetical protein
MRNFAHHLLQTLRQSPLRESPTRVKLIDITVRAKLAKDRALAVVKCFDYRSANMGEDQSFHFVFPSVAGHLMNASMAAHSTAEKGFRFGDEPGPPSIITHALPYSTNSPAGA